MINKILVLPRIWIEAIIKGERWHPEITGKWALISIYSDKLLLDEANKESLELLGCNHYITFRFSDITKITYDSIPEDELKTIHLFTRDQAHQIINFIDKVKNEVDTLVVHCTAGISRSSGVGLFVCRYLGTYEEEFWELNKNIYPNEYILELLMEVSGLRGEYEKIWETLSKEIEDLGPNNIF